MSLIGIAKAIGKLQAVIHLTGTAGTVVSAAEAVATALAEHVQANPSAMLSSEDVRAHIAAAKSEALAVGDEAQAREDARHPPLDGTS